MKTLNNSQMQTTNENSVRSSTTHVTHKDRIQLWSNCIAIDQNVVMFQEKTKVQMHLENAVSVCMRDDYALCGGRVGDEYAR